jgi:hypothetical protein
VVAVTLQTIGIQHDVKQRTLAGSISVTAKERGMSKKINRLPSTPHLSGSGCSKFIKLVQHDVNQRKALSD